MARSSSVSVNIKTKTQNTHRFTMVRFFSLQPNTTCTPLTKLPRNSHPPVTTEFHWSPEASSDNGIPRTPTVKHHDERFRFPTNGKYTGRLSAASQVKPKARGRIRSSATLAHFTPANLRQHDEMSSACCAIASGLKWKLSDQFS